MKPEDDFRFTALWFEALTRSPVTAEGMTMAFLRLEAPQRGGAAGDIGVRFLWLPYLFDGAGPALPDELRAEIVARLRLEADRLESRDLDRRMLALTKGLG